MKRLLLLLLLVASISTRATAQQFALRTNTLYLATATINLGGEVALSDHSSIGASFNLHPWTLGEDGMIKHWFVRPEYRYWISGRNTRMFLSANAMAGNFKVGGFQVPVIGNRVLRSLPSKYYKGSFVAAGVGVGYDFYLAPRWNLEVSAGVGIAREEHRVVPVRRGTFRPSSYSSHWLPMPTEAAISIVYLFNL